MDNPKFSKFLTGYELVQKGYTKQDNTLPEVGLKEVVPNGSWLEQKQIQAALDARKHSIGVERIVRKGGISHAEWRQDLKLAECGRRTGGHWQYFGHTIAGLWYLKPEETLFLMECNLLILHHNEVIVSLEKAYSLLLDNEMSLTLYQVYASLSRVGYKIYRHKVPVAKPVKELVTEPVTEPVIEQVTEPVKEHVTELVTEPVKEIVKDSSRKRKSEDCLETSVKVHKSDIEETDDLDLSLENDGKVTSDIAMEPLSEVAVVQGTVINTICNANTNNIMEEGTDNGIDDQNGVEVKEMEGDDNNFEGDDNKIEGEHKEMECDNNNLEGDHNKIGGEHKEMGSADSKLNADDKTVEMEGEADCFNVNNSANFTIDDNGVIIIVNENEELQQVTLEPQPSSSNCEIHEEIAVKTKDKTITKRTNSYQLKLQKLRSRNLKPLDPKTIEESFTNMPNIYNKAVVTINVPDEKLLPRNIYLNNSVYVLNIENVKTKEISQPSTCLSEVQTNVRRIRSSTENEMRNADVPQFHTFQRLQRFQNPQFRQTWRSPLNVNYYPPFQTFFPRPYLTPSFYAHRFRFHQYHTFTRPAQNMECHRQHNVNRRRPNPQLKYYHLQAIKNLATKVQRLAQMFRGIDTRGLYRCLASYNSRYNERLRLTRDLEVVNYNDPTEIIELVDEEESSSKKRRIDDTFDKHLNSIKVLVGKLKELVDKNQCSSRHRRAISNLIKKFNKSFNADIYMDSEYNIIDRKLITIDSDSENESKKKNRKRKKKLRNPFNILKQMSVKVNSEETVSSEEDLEIISIETSRDTLLKYFAKEWIPSDDDFGRPEVCTKHSANTHITETHDDQLLYNFIEDRQGNYKNWVDLKMSFVLNLEASNLAHENQQINIQSKDFIMDFDSKFKPIIGQEDCKDMPTVLEKLRIIQTVENEPTGTSLRIHFDAYNRDVQNFSKKDPPIPHFRIICIEETAEFPSGSDISALHSKYDDNVPFVFAVVGHGSISYLRMNPYNLDVYIPSYDLV